jgi:hypothetical protein
MAISRPVTLSAATADAPPQVLNTDDSIFGATPVYATRRTSSGPLKTVTLIAIPVAVVAIAAGLLLSSPARKAPLTDKPVAAAMPAPQTMTPAPAQMAEATPAPAPTTSMVATPAPERAAPVTRANTTRAAARRHLGQRRQRHRRDAGPGSGSRRGRPRPRRAPGDQPAGTGNRHPAAITAVRSPLPTEKGGLLPEAALLLESGRRLAG